MRYIFSVLALVIAAVLLLGCTSGQARATPTPAQATPLSSPALATPAPMPADLVEIRGMAFQPARGTFNYHCSIHPGMLGEAVVLP